MCGKEGWADGERAATRGHARRVSGTHTRYARVIRQVARSPAHSLSCGFRSCDSVIHRHVNPTPTHGRTSVRTPSERAHMRTYTAPRVAPFPRSALWRYGPYDVSCGGRLTIENGDGGFCARTTPCRGYRVMSGGEYSCTRLLVPCSLTYDRGKVVFSISAVSRSASGDFFNLDVRSRQDVRSMQDARASSTLPSASS